MEPHKTARCKHGIMSWYNEDELVGYALDLYGEYSEGEVEVFRKILKPGDIAIDVGANIGAFTVPMAKLVGGGGKIYAFEASEKNALLLRKNIADNDLANIEVIAKAASDGPGPLRVSSQDAYHAYSKSGFIATDLDFEIDAMRIDDLK